MVNIHIHIYMYTRLNLSYIIFVCYYKNIRMPKTLFFYEQKKELGYGNFDLFSTIEVCQNQCNVRYFKLEYMDYMC